MYNWAEQISSEQVWAKDMMKITVTFCIQSTYNQRSLLFTFCNLRRHFSDLNFVTDDFNRKNKAKAEKYKFESIFSSCNISLTLTNSVYFKVGCCL